ncbi:MAG: AtpZ/AtpI family protein [Phycisphaeraceae bacterium]|nr:AtpZ/AtpI family protein [Phycisphaeraceae bacterium]
MAGQPVNPELQRLIRLAAMGGSLAAKILAAGVIGWLLDRWLSTGPWLLVILLLLGTTSALIQFIREALRESGGSAIGASRGSGPGPGGSSPRRATPAPGETRPSPAAGKKDRTG